MILTEIQLAVLPAKQPYSVIGNTPDFDSAFPGSSPGRATFFDQRDGSQVSGIGSQDTEVHQEAAAASAHFMPSRAAEIIPPA